MKSEVYSWRLSPALKNALEETARQEPTTVATLLERIVAGWLASHRQERNQEEAEQQRLHALVASTFGTLRGSNPSRSEQVRSLVRARVAKRYAR
jgi:hypothetical protein